MPCPVAKRGLSSLICAAWRLITGLLLVTPVATAAVSGGGIVITGISGRVQAMAIDGLGRLVTVGYPSQITGFTSQITGYALTRFNSDGTPDSSFGNAGVVSTDFSNEGHATMAYAIAVDKFGRIVVAGESYPLGKPFENSDFLLARYNSDGTLDSGFGIGGVVRTEISGGGSNDSAHSVAIDAFGRIVAAGFSGPPSKPALARYNSDGSLDGTFGIGGIVVTGSCGGASGSGVHAVTIDSIGRIVTAGTCYNSFMLARYSTGGALDESFGGGGIAVIPSIGGSGGSEFAAAVAIDGMGRIVAGGEANTVSGVSGNIATSFGLVRCNSDGTLDTTFGSGGILTTHLSGDGIARDDYAAAIMLDYLGRIVAVGGCPSDCGAFEFEVARYNSDGSLDTTFGAGGIVVTQLGNAGSNNLSQAVAIDALGRIVAAGSSDDYAALVRYNPDGTLDRSFDSPLTPWRHGHPRPR